MTYKKGKDIKASGDCLVYCYTRRIEIFVSGITNPNICVESGAEYNIGDKICSAFFKSQKTEGFEKW